MYIGWRDKRGVREGGEMRLRAVDRKVSASWPAASEPEPCPLISGSEKTQQPEAAGRPRRPLFALRLAGKSCVAALGVDVIAAALPPSPFSLPPRR